PIFRVERQNEDVRPGPQEAGLTPLGLAVNQALQPVQAGLGALGLLHVLLQLLRRRHFVWTHQQGSHAFSPLPALQSAVLGSTCSRTPTCPAVVHHPTVQDHISAACTPDKWSTHSARCCRASSPTTSNFSLITCWASPPSSSVRQISLNSQSNVQRIRSNVRGQNSDLLLVTTERYASSFFS